MQRALGVADSFDSASTNQAPSCRCLTFLKTNFFLNTTVLATSPQNGRALPSCTSAFRPRARWIVDREQTDVKRSASRRGDSGPAK